MSDTTRDMLIENLKHIEERLVEIFDAYDRDMPYFEEIPWPEDVEPDTYGDLYDEDGNAWPSEEDQKNVSDFEDGMDPDQFLYEYVLEVVDERGRNFAVVIATGGPHIEIEAEGLQMAQLHGYWGGEHVVRYGEIFGRTLDFFIDRD